ncbi:MAG: ABC transporter permease subunit [Lachnospiraceae bacterium]|nr:ABC transporter permease subunit [Lachnospiraceae bacterium]
MKGSGIIIRKELKRVFGDRKLVFSLFILPAILVVVIYSLMGVLISSMQKDIEEHISITYVVNATEGLKSAISGQGFDKNADITYLTETQYAEQKKDIESLMLEGNVDLIVVQDPRFDSKVAAYSKAGDAIPVLNIYFNSAENYSNQAYGEFSKVLDAYRTLLLADRVGNLELLNVFTQNEEIIVKEEKANSQFISMMLPYLITMMLFAGAMSVGVDAIAGEKERGTLASMLLTPVKRNEIVVGKLVSMAILSGLSAIVYAVAMIIAMPMMGGAMGDMAEAGFGGLSFGVTQALELLVIMLVMVYLYVAIIGLLAVIAKDVKTASTYISPVYIVVILAGMMTMFNSGKDRPIFHYMIPVYGNALAIGDLCGNELTTPNFLACLAGSAVVAVILTAAVTRAFNSEKIMFNA